MKIQNREIFVIAFVFFLLFICSGCEDFYGSVEGIITDEETGDPISNAKMLIVSSKDSTMLFTTTDENGYYLIDGARFGMNQLRVWKDGYKNDKKVADILDGAAIQIDFELETIEIKTTINIVVNVINQVTGLPLDNATVDLYKEVDAGKVYSNTVKIEPGDGPAVFTPGFVEKGENQKYEVRIAAQGYHNAVEAFDLEWVHAHPTWIVQMQPN